MYVIAWEYLVKPGQEAAFHQAYGPEGGWILLFRQSPGFLGTELLHDEQNAQRFMTVDRWTSRAAFDSFHADWQAEYQAHDELCSSLTEQETFLGAFALLSV